VDFLKFDFEKENLFTFGGCNCHAMSKSLEIIKIERAANEQVIELLDANVIGTPGKSMVYRHNNVRKKVANIPNPYFANLSIRNRLYGTICLSKRNVFSCGKPHQAFYLRYFTFRESFRSSNPNDNSGNSSNKIREEVANLMNGAGLDYDGDLPRWQAGLVLYAYVDKDNIRSRRLIEEFGFEKMGDFNVIPFSRFYPKSNPNVEILAPEHIDKFKGILKNFYGKEQLTTLDHVGANGKYFVIRDKDEFVCGVQAIPDSWEIKELPGVTGKIMMGIMPRLPVIGRLFKPQYNFVFLESSTAKTAFMKNWGFC